MKLAVTYENGNVFQHFGHTEMFQVYEIEDEKIVRKALLGSGGSGHGALAELLLKNGVNVLICGGIGGGAKVALREANVQVYGGVTGNVDEAVKAFIDGELQYDPDVVCTHHEGDDHDCGNHNHSCRHE
ncbi:MAG: dinitrogenase iron-molybdenum cofactor biosynthesis protein [Clostridiales bacterium]|nr:dinitrogenase iron-molybdenum cofactor biosynthesis protein [Clostridiales bacterium]